jgi:hypothetical protein
MAGAATTAGNARGNSLTVALRSGVIPSAIFPGILRDDRGFGLCPPSIWYASEAIATLRNARAPRR